LDTGIVAGVGGGCVDARFSLGWEPCGRAGISLFDTVRERDLAMSMSASIQREPFGNIYISGRTITKPYGLPTHASIQVASNMTAFEQL